MTTNHTIRFPDDLYAKLKALAVLEDRNVNSEVVAIIRAAVTDYERRNGPISPPPDKTQSP